jgi:adenylate cyclase
MVIPGGKFLKSEAVIGLLICLLACGLVIGLRSAGVLQSMELSAYDYYLRYQPELSTPEPRIELVTVSEPDITRLGWPINDGVLTKLLKQLLARNPRIIGLDIYRNIEMPPGCDELRELFSEDVPVVTPRKFGDEKSEGVADAYMVKNKNRIGFNDAMVDPGGIVRRGLLFMDDGETSYTSFAMLLALGYLEKEGIGTKPDPKNPELLRLGKTTFIPLEADSGGYAGMDARGYQFLLNFSSAKAGFSSISISQALEGDFSEEAVRDKIVIIGATAESLKDAFFLPFNRSPAEGQRIWGVEVHATSVAQLLRCALEGRKPMRFWSGWKETCWILLWGLLGYGACLKLQSFPKFVFAVVVLFPAILAGATFFLFCRRLWIPVAPPVFTLALSAGFFRIAMLSLERRNRGLLMRLFESHVSKDIAKAIWEQREQFVQEGVPRPMELTATVLFTDLRGFTTISERFGDARKLMEWLNEYMEAMTTEVLGHGGVVNKYIGDAIMAVFGVPVARTSGEEIARDALNAVRCAIRMGERLEEINERWRTENRPTVQMRVGIFTGPLVVGCVGSRHRLEYTVIGDTVNIASRLESFKKELDAESTCRVLIGESTWKCVGEQFRTRGLGSIALKGKDQCVEIYQVLGAKEEDDGTVIREVCYEMNGVESH